MRILLFTALFLLSTQAGAKEPAWVKDVSKGCSKSELCAVGEGSGKNSARRNARVELANIFSIKVTSKFKSSLTSDGKETFESMSEEIEESTNQALEGVEVKKFYEGDENVYALASINKTKAKRGLKKEIDKIDEKMRTLIGETSGSSTMKLERHYFKREVLLKKYEFLGGPSIPSPISYSEIFRRKKETTNNVIVHVYVDEDDPKLTEAAIIKILSDSGYRITTGRKRNRHSTHVVTGELVADKQYMKVEGFEKYKISLKLSAWSKGKVETGHLNYSSTQVGRSYSQAYAKAVPMIETYIKDNLANLNID